MAEPQKEGMHITGKINAHNDYTNQKGVVSYTLDIAVLGFRNLVPVRVSADMFHKMKDGDPFSAFVVYSEGKWGSSFALA